MDRRGNKNPDEIKEGRKTKELLLNLLKDRK
jgi:hypothetical protein